MTEKTHVFISYSRNDYDFVVRLRQALDKYGIQQWIDQKDLRAGTHSWEQALRDAIKVSYVVIYVGSEAARKSDYVRDEIALASLYKVNIIPVWAAGNEWLECVPIGHGGRQFVDLRRDKFDHNFNKLLAEIKKETPEIIIPPSFSVSLSAGETPRNPYKGLNAFTGKDVADFFGRDELVNQLLDAVKGRVADSKDRLLTVIGASGSGKSSVVMAGLLPKLQAGALVGSSDWTYLKQMVPGDHPVQALNRILLETTELNVPIDLIESDLKHSSGMGLYRLATKIPKKPVVLYIDQFEELFMTSVLEDERQQFISLLTYAVTQPDSPILVLLTLRADFYDRPMNYPELGRLVQAYNRSVLPMSIADLRDTVEKPATAAGLTFEAGLVADIIFDLRDDKNAQAGALPLLQYALEQLYERRSDRTLTNAAYTEIGGVKGAIGAHAEQVFLTLDVEAQNAFGRVFQALVHVDERGTPTRKREAEAVLMGIPATARLIEVLIKHARVLRVYTEKLGDIPYVEVAHEALLTSWERLSNWIKSVDNDLRLIQEMKADTARWIREGYPKHLLWPHELLQPLYQSLKRLPQDLTNDELHFIRPEVERLLEEFGNLSDHVQLTMLELEFSRIGEESIPALIKAYSFCKSDEVRDEIQQFLSEFHDQTVISIREAIHSSKTENYENVMNLIVDLHWSVFTPELLKASTDNNLDMRIRDTAEEILRDTSDENEDAIGVLIEGLRDREIRVQEMAVQVLAHIASPDLVPKLAKLLNDTNKLVAKAARKALRLMYIDEADDALAEYNAKKKG